MNLNAKSSSRSIGSRRSSSVPHFGHSRLCLTMSRCADVPIVFFFRHTDKLYDLVQGNLRIQSMHEITNGAVLR